MKIGRFFKFFQIYIFSVFWLFSAQELLHPDYAEEITVNIIEILNIFYLISFNIEVIWTINRGIVVKRTVPYIQKTIKNEEKIQTFLEFSKKSSF